MQVKADIFDDGGERVGQGALARYASEAPYYPMKALARAASRRGLTLEGLARQLDRDPRALVRTLLAEKPRYSSVKDLAAALGYPAALAKALTKSPLNADDQKIVRLRIEREMTVLRAGLFIDPRAVLDAASEAIAKLSPEQRNQLLSDFLLIYEGFGEMFNLDEDNLFNRSMPTALILSPALLGLYSSLKRAGTGFSFLPFLNNRRKIHAEEIVTMWRCLESAAPFSEDERRTLRDLVERYVPNADELDVRSAVDRVVTAFYSPYVDQGDSQEENSQR